MGAEFCRVHRTGIYTGNMDRRNWPDGQPRDHVARTLSADRLWACATGFIVAHNINASMVYMAFSGGN